MLLSLHPDYVMYHTISPNGVDKCDVSCTWLFDKKTIESKKYSPNDAVNFWDMTNKQDWKISELSQLGIQSKKYVFVVVIADEQPASLSPVCSFKLT